MKKQADIRNMVLVIEIDKNPKTVEKKKQRSVVIDSDSEEEIVQPKAVKKVIKQTYSNLMQCH
jgi:hypothetical protein